MPPAHQFEREVSKIEFRPGAQVQRVIREQYSHLGSKSESNPARNRSNGRCGTAKLPLLCDPEGTLRITTAPRLTNALSPISRSCATTAPGPIQASWPIVTP